MLPNRLTDEEFKKIPFYRYPKELSEKKLRKKIYSNIILSEEPKRIIMKGLTDPEISEDEERVRFAIYVEIDMFHKESNFWCSPSLPSFADKTDFFEKQKHYNKSYNVVVKAHPTSTGVVHLEAKRCAMMGINKKKINPTKIKFEIGLSAFLSNRGEMILLNRSTMQFSVQSLHELAFYCFLFNPLKFIYDQEKRNFKTKHSEAAARSHTFAYTLERSLAKKETNYILSALQIIFKKNFGDTIRVVLDKKNIKNFKWERIWKEKTREKTQEWLLESVFITAFLPNEPHGEYFILLSDYEIAKDILKTANNYHLSINLNKVPEIFTKYTKTPLLIFATRKNDFCFIKLCIAYGSDVTIKDEYDRDALNYARKNYPAIKKIDCLNRDVEEKIIHACKNNRSRAFELLNSLELKLNLVPCSSYFARLRIMLIDEKKPSAEKIKNLLLDISDEIDKSKKIKKLLEELHELYVAIKDNDSKKCLKKLTSLKEKFDLNKLIFERKNLLCLAIKYNRIDALKVLISFGLNLDLPGTEEGDAPLLYSLIKKHLTTAKLLLDYTLNTNILSSQKQAPLFLAIRLKDTELVKKLLEHKTNPANPNISHPATGITPLLYSIHHDLFDVAKLLITHKANINQRRSGLWESPLELAKAKNNEKGHEMVKLLEKMGANDNRYAGKKRQTR